MSDMSGFITGLSQGLNAYLGQNIQQNREMQKEGYKSQLETQKQETLQTQKSQLDTQKDFATKLYEQTIAGKIDPEVASQIHPDAAKAVKDFQTTNGRLPTVEEFSKLKFKDQNEPTKYDKQQDTLEKQYADRLSKVVQARTGGLGLQDSKVNQAIDLRTLVNQYYDPKTGEYTIPPAQHSELALGLARLLSPQGTVPIELEKQLRQSTGREALSNVLIYAGMDPQQVGGPTQSVIKMFVDSIDRQGQTAEKLRDKYISGLKGLVPSGLDPKRAEKLTKSELTSSYNKVLEESPEHKKMLEGHQTDRVTVISPNGQRGSIPASQLDEALKAGYKQG